MSCKLGLWIGDSFAELRGISAPSPSQVSSGASTLFQNRWFLPKKSLEDGLRESLALRGDPTPLAQTAGVLTVVTTRADRAFNDRRFTEPTSVAVLVTSGFESWLRATAPLETPEFSWQPKRASLPIEEDRVFGISERLMADGSVKTPLKLEELEFLVAKLQLLKIKDVAVCFLHSKVNADHENQAASYLREKGFRVTVSSRLAELAKFASAEVLQDEGTRWRQTLEAALAESAIETMREQIFSAFDLKSPEAIAKSQWKIQFAGVNGPQAIEQTSAAELRGSASLTLTQTAPLPMTLHLGLDQFLWVDQRTEPKHSGSRTRLLPVQPTQQIGLSAFAIPTLIENNRSTDAGPMLFGRSHQPTFLDLLAVRDRLQAGLEGFDAFISERMRPRILESLMALGKMINEKRPRPIDAAEVAGDLELLCMDRLAAAIVAAEPRGEIAVTGALASAFEPMLRKRLPQFSFRVPQNAVWALPDAALTFEAPKPDNKVSKK